MYTECSCHLVDGTKKSDHISPVLKSLHWLSVVKRIDFKVPLLVYHALQDEAPEYMTDMLQEKTNARILHSTDSSQSAVPRNRHKVFGNHHFSIAPARLWNGLPGSIADCKSIAALKKKKSLKTHLSKAAFD